MKNVLKLVCIFLLTGLKCLAQETTSNLVYQIEEDYKDVISKIDEYTLVNINTDEHEGYKLAEYYLDTELILMIDTTSTVDQEELKTYYFENGDIKLIILQETVHESTTEGIRSNQSTTKVYYDSVNVFHITKIYGDEDKVKYQSYFDNQLRATKEYIEKKKTGNKR